MEKQIVENRFGNVYDQKRRVLMRQNIFIPIFNDDLQNSHL